MKALFQRIAVGALTCVAALAAPAFSAAAEDAAHSDPKALELLGSVSKAYQALSDYSDQGEFVQSITVNGKKSDQNLPMRLTLSRPNKYVIDAGEVRVVSDGKTVSTVVSPFKKYKTSPAPEAITFDTFREGPLGSILFGGPSAPTSALFLSLLADPAAVKAITEGGGIFTLEPDREVGGEATRAILLNLTKGADFRFLIDPETRLLKGIDWVIDAKELAAEAGPGQTVAVGRIGWSAGKVSTKAPKADAFAFKAPTGFARVEAFERPGGDEPKSPILGLVGKPAPDFTTTVLEPGGKTRTMTKADLAGKVVLIDFWATWCPPCRAELPDIQKLIESYAGDKKEVVILAQSVDQKPKEPAALRKLIDETFDEEKVKLGGTPVGLVAIDPGGELSETFLIQAIPALVLLDAKGIVQAAYVGQRSGEALRKDIDTLLQGKSLLAPKAGADAAGAGN